ncbi:MAG TPA: anti-anti-sigma factor [Ruminococcaceae bacterium]|nr:anti-anti-sigma factor [Oscillospiraceae bacterium]
MSVRIENKGDVVTAYLEGELDHHNAKAIREDVDAALDRHSPGLLVLDFREITFMDSSGIGLVMGRYKKLQGTGAQIHITGTSPPIYKVMQIAGLSKLANIDKGGKTLEKTAE